MLCQYMCWFISEWLTVIFEKRKTVRYRLQCMGHVEATTAAPRVKGPAAHRKIGHPWMKFTSARSRNGQTVTLPGHRAPERQSRRQAPLHKSISQVKAARELTQTRVARSCEVIYKRSYKNYVFRVEIPIKAYAASMGTTITHNIRSNHIWEK